MSTIFICYRREDTAPYAGRLYDRLTKDFGYDQVFMDIDNIAPGQDFEQVIDKQLASCRVTIVLIGDRWLGETATGTRRIDDTADYVRREIKLVLGRDIRVIPALVAGARMPSFADLPDDIVSLARRQAVFIDNARFHRDVDRLTDALRPILKSSLPASSSDTPYVPEKFNFSEWRNHETYFVWAAACLWINAKPVEQIGTSHPAYPALQKIKGAIQAGRIHSEDGSFGMTARVKWRELLTLAHLYQEKPKFLFNDDGTPTQAPRGLSTKEIGSYMVELASEIQGFLDDEPEFKSDRDILDFYGAKTVSRLSYLYQEAERRGYQDAELKTSYKEPKGFANVQQVATRLGAMGRKLQQASD